jgi:hypothetical protein
VRRHGNLDGDLLAARLIAGGALGIRSKTAQRELLIGAPMNALMLVECASAQRFGDDDAAGARATWTRRNRSRC